MRIINPYQPQIHTCPFGHEYVGDSCLDCNAQSTKSIYNGAVYSVFLGIILTLLFGALVPPFLMIGAAMNPGVIIGVQVGSLPLLVALVRARRVSNACWAGRNQALGREEIMQDKTPYPRRLPKCPICGEPYQGSLCPQNPRHRIDKAIFMAFATLFGSLGAYAGFVLSVVLIEWMTLDAAQMVGTFAGAMLGVGILSLSLLKRKKPNIQLAEPVVLPLE